jgi:hypothetical protein
MGLNHSPRIVANGLLLYNDAVNTQKPRVGATSLTLNGSMSDASNNYYTLDGTDDSISISSSVYNTPYTGKTIMVAAYMDSSFGGGFRGMIGTSSGTSQRNFNLYTFGSPGNFQYHYSTGDGIGNTGSFNGSALTTPANQWFVASISQTSTTVTYYHNAINVGSVAHGLSQYNSGTNEFLGRADNFWYGRIGFWMVYSRALSASEVQQNFNALRGRYGI